jgi:UDP-N-acetylmuramoyl-tripeptide--D-alanyl-D-alanine ligase
MLWTSAELQSALGGRIVGSLPDGVVGISIDSRSVSKGDAFFAIKGDRVDGHDYADKAVANGAALLVVSEDKLPAVPPLDCPMIVVDDVLVALERLAMAARARSSAKIIAVTGSVGKTTTKEMLRHVLMPCGAVHASAASFNNHWGVPLTLARMPRDTDFGIFEIGMNHPDEIRPLVKMVRPQIAMITSIAAAHLGNFASLEEIALAKAEIMEGIAADGHILLPRDNAYFPLLEKVAKDLGVAHVHSFGSQDGADCRLVDCHETSDGSSLNAVFAGVSYPVSIGAPGRHLVDNALAVLAATRLAGADMTRVVPAFATIRPEKGRGQRHELAIGDGFFTVIDESYNANPASMRAAIALLQSAKPHGSGRRIAVLGDMLEMGAFSAQVHAELADPLRQAGIRHVWLAGPEMNALRQTLTTGFEVEYRALAADLTDHVLTHVQDGDVLMLKSSNGMGFGKIVAALIENYKPVSRKGDGVPKT